MNRSCRFPIRLARFAGSRQAAACLVAVLLCGAPGCRRDSETGLEEIDAAKDASTWRQEYFQYAVRNLGRLEQYGPGDMQQQIVDRLNQWAQVQSPPPDWQVDPMVQTLPEPLAKLEEVRSLAKLAFLRSDGPALQEAVWLRDVSNWARGKQLDEPSRAKRLFDWVVRNIQLAPDPADPAKAVPNRPWETLLLGRGTAVDRGWVYVLLLRHQGIDAALLALPTGRSGKDEASGAPWAVGVFIGGQVYLFDPALGLPIPGPDGPRLDEAGQLDSQPATLAQAAADDRLLRRLDVESEPYPVKAEQLKSVVALVEASPAALSARMELVESRLVGDEKVLLSVQPSKVAQRLRAASGVADVKLWQWPFEVARRRASLTPEEEAAQETALRPFKVGKEYPLWRGRSLHLKGDLAGAEGATYFYRQARPANWKTQDLRDSALEAAKTPEAAKQAQQMADAYERAKLDASYWQGLVAVELGNHDAAANYFDALTLRAAPGGPWTEGARYNLARLLEKLGRRSEAIELYQADKTSPDHHGNQLRAAWLRLQPAEQSLPGETP